MTVLVLVNWSYIKTLTGEWEREGGNLCKMFVAFFVLFCVFLFSLFLTLLISQDWPLKSRAFRAFHSVLFFFSLSFILLWDGHDLHSVMLELWLKRENEREMGRKMQKSNVVQRGRASLIVLSYSFSLSLSLSLSLFLSLHFSIKPTHVHLTKNVYGVEHCDDYHCWPLEISLVLAKKREREREWES